jgi:hypothetical protein
VSAFDGVNPIDPNVNVNVSDITTTSSFFSLAHLTKLRRAQVLESADSIQLFPGSNVNFVTPQNSDDKGSYVAGLSLHNILRTAAAPANFGILIGNIVEDVEYDISAIFDLNSLGNTVNDNRFQTRNPMYLINNFFPSTVDTTGAGLIIEAVDETNVFSDSVGFVGFIPGATPLLNTISSTITLGENNFTVNQRGIANLGAYTLGALP